MAGRIPDASADAPGPANGDELGQGSAALVAARIDRLPATRFHRRLIATLGAGTLFDGFDALSMAAALPVIVATLHISFATAGFIISGGYLGQLIGALVIGAISEHTGRKPAYLICLALFGALSFASALSWNGPALLVMRFLQGFGLGAAMPLGATIVNEYLGPAIRGKYALIYQSSFPWGMFLAPLTGAVLIAVLGAEQGWRVLFMIGALPILIAIYAVRHVPESARWLAAKGRRREADTIVSAIERETTAHGEVLDEPHPVQTTVTGTFRMAELFQNDYRQRIIVLWTAWFCTFFVLYGCTVWLPTIYVRIGGLAPGTALLLSATTALVSVMPCYAAALVVDRIGRRPILIASFSTAIAGLMLGIAGTAFFTPHWVPLFIAGFITSVAISVPSGVLYIYTCEQFPTRMRSWATGSCGAMNRLASVLSPLLVAYVLQFGLGIWMAFVAFVAASLAALLAIRFKGIETRGRSLEELAP